MNYLNILRELEIDGWDLLLNNDEGEWHLHVRDHKLDVRLKSFHGTLEEIIRKAYIYVNKVER